MNDRVSRRDLLRFLSAAGIGAGALGLSDRAAADTMGNGEAAKVVGGKVIQPEREIALLHQTDVLVVGGGPAGTAAAIAATPASPAAGRSTSCSASTTSCAR